MSSDTPIISQPVSSSDRPAVGGAPTRCGYVALVGRPNTGKSTLFNAFLGQPLSIVTSKPQTTRSRVLGILTRPRSQIIFLDTPGLLEPSYKLHESMERQIFTAAREADLVLLLMDASRPRDGRDLIRGFLERSRVPLIAALNKIDLLTEAQVQAQRAQLRRELGLKNLLPISALGGEGVDDLLENAESLLPSGPKLYPDSMISDQPERFFVSEFIRAAAFNNLLDELPYALNVAVESFADRPEKTYVQALIFVERESQKGIVIGRKGSLLRKIGREARLQIEEFLQRPVYLDLWVKVRPDWRKRERDLTEFGYMQ